MKTLKIALSAAVVLAVVAGFYISGQKRTEEANRVLQEASVEKEKADQRRAAAEKKQLEQQSGKADLALLPPTDAPAAPSAAPTPPQTALTRRDRPVIPAEPANGSRAASVGIIKESHAKYLAQFDLTDAQYEALADALVDFGSANAAALRNAAQAGVTPANNPQQFQLFLDAARADAVARIKPIVGDEGLRALDVYRETAPERLAVNRIVALQSQFNASNNSLDPNQRAQLLQALIASVPAITTVSGVPTGNVGLVITQATVDSAASYLSTAQLEILQRAAASQVVQAQAVDERIKKVEAAKAQAGGGN